MLCNVGVMSCNVGGVKCKPFLKHYCKWALKIIFKGSGNFQVPEAVVTSTEKESLCFTQTWFTTSSRCFIGVKTVMYNCNKLR